MTDAQRFILTELDDDAQRVEWLRRYAVDEMANRAYGRTIWTLPDGSRVERTVVRVNGAHVRGVAAWGTLPSLVGLIERTLKADRQTVVWHRRCEANARLQAKRTGEASWEAAADEWATSRLRLQANIRRHIRELIRLRRGQHTYTECRLDQTLFREAA